jgi:hypothetical protein
MAFSDFSHPTLMAITEAIDPDHSTPVIPCATLKVIKKKP